MRCENKPLLQDDPRFFQDITSTAVEVGLACQLASLHPTFPPSPLSVGSRTDAKLLRSNLSVAPRFLWERLTNRIVSRFSAPAASNRACPFRALGFPACFLSRFMGPIVLERLSVVARSTVFDSHLNSPSTLCSHSLLHRFQPNPLHFRARIRCLRIFFSTQSWIIAKHRLECPTLK